MNDHRRQLLQFMLAAGALPALPLLAATPQPLTRAIPGTGEALPAVGLGTWRAFDVPRRGQSTREAQAALEALVKLGGRVVDTSPMYGRAEETVGRLGEDLGDKLFVATKIWTTGAAEGKKQLAQSFKHLRRPKLDLVQVHNLLDAGVHLKTLRAEKEAGRVRYIGITHYRASAHGDLMRWMRNERPDFIQVNYSLQEPEAGAEVLPLAAELGIAVLINRPFAEGQLFDAVNNRGVPRWAREELGCQSWAQVFLKWILAEPAVTCVLTGTRDAEHLADSLGAASSPLPTAEQRQRLQALL
ncbi:MAG: aldo/keto reductase [Rhodanobacteraceae bacterium]|nr:aldo/keto reductase [Rhodanobacteraceae bacterium]